MTMKFISNNNNKKLIIIFQSAGRIPMDIFPKIKNNQVTDSEVKQYHKKYNWLKFTKKYIGADFLIIEDYYSKSYGWYMLDQGEFIYEKLNKEISSFLEQRNYRKVIAFGSSKGGTGALLYGMLNKHITHVFAMVPQIKVATYINKYYTEYRDLFFGENFTEQKVTQIDSLLFSDKVKLNQKNTIFYIYTGINDDQFNDILKYSNYLKEITKSNNLIINISEEKHSPIVTNNTDFVYNLLEAISEGKSVNEKRLIKLMKGYFLFKKLG